jgi:hypothetical protein
VKIAPELQRHPWVIMSFFGVSAGFWVMLWAGLEGWWPAFAVSAVGFGSGVAGVFLWLRMTGTPLPELRDYLTLVKTITKLRV